MNTVPVGASSYLRWVIASEYYDGAMAGVGERMSDGSIVWFRVVAWDDEQWRRVLAVTCVDQKLVSILRQRLESIESGRLPFWFPGPSADTPDVRAAWAEIIDSAMHSSAWWFVEAHDLLDAGEEHKVAPPNVPRVVANVRSATVLVVAGSALKDAFLRQIEKPG